MTHTAPVLSPAGIRRVNLERYKRLLENAQFSLHGRRLNECHGILEGIADRVAKIDPQCRIFDDWKTGHGQSVTIKDVMQVKDATSADLMEVITNRVNEALKGVK